MNPFDPGYYSEDELRGFGFAAVGHHVRVAKNCTIIGLEKIALGNHVRIDGYTVIAATGDAPVRIGSYVHIAGSCTLIGGAGIVMEDFSGLSHGVRLYSRSDDYSGHSLTNPTVPARYLNVKNGLIQLKKHAIVGAGAVILPGVTVEEGDAIGALSLLAKSTTGWGMYGGVPAKRLKDRARALLALEEQLHAEQV